MKLALGLLNGMALELKSQFTKSTINEHVIMSHCKYLILFMFLFKYPSAEV